MAQFDRLLAAPVDAVAAVLRQFHLDVPLDLERRIVQSAVLTRYSKAPEFSYSPQLRTQLLAQARMEHAQELRKGLDFLGVLANMHPAVAELL